jgi:hypothetical protein
MDELLPKLPRLSQEATDLFFAGVGYASPAVDLSGLLALPGEHRPCVVKAALRWGMQPHQVVV